VEVVESCRAGSESNEDSEARHLSLLCCHYHPANILGFAKGGDKSHCVTP